MNVLSLFDGISCARAALDRAGISVDRYYASEVDKFAIKVSEANYPDIIRLGDVRSVDFRNLGEIDLLIGGSPCQDLSVAKAGRQGLQGEKSGLFWEYVRILKELQPRYFILENVASMRESDKRVISEALQVEPVMIDAALVSAQRRRRYFWTNIKGVGQPADQGLVLKDVLLDEYDPRLVVKRSLMYTRIEELTKKKLTQIDGEKGITMVARQYVSWRGQYVSTKKIVQKARGYNKGAEFQEKSPALTCNSFEQNNMVVGDGVIRKLDPVECERLQGLPDGYTASVSNTQRYKCLGNAFNVDVIAHILRCIENPMPVEYGYQLSLYPHPEVRNVI